MNPFRVSAAAAAACAERHYGLAGRASPLAGEKDQNFLVTTPDRGRFVLKVSHPDEDLRAVLFQTAALAHVAAADPGLGVPEVLPAADGAREIRVAFGDGPGRIVRLFTYREGMMLHQSPPCARQDRALGESLARLGVALRGFTTPDPRRRLLWDLQHLPQTRPLIAAVADSVQRAQIERVYDDFDRFVRDSLAALRTQTIHNDMNPYNVVVDAGDAARIVGILDFGDLVRGPLVCDMAVGAAYRWTPDEHPMAGIVRFLQGYAVVCDIDEPELEVLPDLVQARLAMTLTVSEWQAAEEPDNREYSLRLQPELRRALDRLRQVPRTRARQLLRDALAANA